MPAFHATLNLSKNEAQNHRLHNSASDLASPSEGMFYYNTTSKKPRWYDGTTWQELGSGGGTVTSVALSLPAIFSVTGSPVTSSGTLTATLASQTGNLVWASPNGSSGAPTFRSLVQNDIPATIPLSYWAAATANLNLGGFKITNAADGTANTDYVTLQQMNAAIAGQKKTSARGATIGVLTITARTTTTLTVGGTSLSIDGVTYANGDVILVKNDTTGVGGAGAADNGKYTVSGVGTSILLTRTADMDTAGETDGHFVVVEDGTTMAGTLWTMTSEVTTLGTDSVTWTQLNRATDLVAGAGLVATGLTWDIVATNTSLTVNANDVGVNLNTTGGLEISSGVRIKPDTVTANTIGITTTANGAGILFNSTSFTDQGSETLALAAGVAGNGLSLSSGALAVNVDGSSIQITTDTLSVQGYTFVSGTTVARKYAAAITLATGAYTQTVTHNLNTRDVQVWVYDSTSNLWIITDVEHSTVNAVIISGTNNSGASISARCVVVG